MTQQAPIRAERRSCPKCHNCGATMRLLGIEAHPTIDRTDLLTYVCSHCEGLQTETVPHTKLKVFPQRGMVRPIDSLLVNKAFDAETTQLLGSMFDAAWERVEASNRQLVDGRHAASMRELLAKCIIGMVEQGERDPNRLIEKALLRLRIILRAEATA
jgi:hypothetical protein